MTTARTAVLAALLAFAAAGCDRNPTSPTDAAPELGTARDHAVADPAGGCGDLPTAPPELRVDLYEPSFANPTSVTNPLFPIADLHRVLLLGTVDGEPLRVETTLLARTEPFRLGGRRVRALASQYVAWLGRDIHEVAIDWYVQDDAGATWYLGEDVFNYEGGRIADREGTWRAERDGPAAMIMPADPQVGNVWRPENICGLVFEEVTATATGVTVQGPRGAVAGALVVRELHMDGSLEEKIFAPGYGEFSTGSGANLEAVALAVPTDALAEPLPGELETIADGAEAIFQAARSRDWDEASEELDELNAAWNAYRAGGVPPMLDAQMASALDALASAVESQEAGESRQASIEVAQASLDLQLRYLPWSEIDEEQLELWGLQLRVHAEARDRDAVRSDVVSMRWIQRRLQGQGGRDLDRDLEARLDAVSAAAEAGDLAAVDERAARLSVRSGR